MQNLDNTSPLSVHGWENDLNMQKQESFAAPSDNTDRQVVRVKKGIIVGK